MKTINVEKGKLSFTDEIEAIFEKEVTKFGTGAKIDAVKKHLGKKAYVLICKSNPRKLFKQNKAKLNVKRGKK